MNRPHKTDSILIRITLSVSSIMVSINNFNNFLSAEHRSMTMILENLFALQILWTDRAQMWKWADFSWETNLLLQNQWLLFIQQRNTRFFEIVVKTYGNVNCCVWFSKTQTLQAGNAKFCILIWFVLMITFDSFQCNQLNFSNPGLNQQIGNCRSSFIDKNLRNVSCIVHIKNRIGQKVQNCQFFPEKQAFCFPKQLDAFPSGYQSTFFSREKLRDCQTTLVVPCNRNLMGQTSQK